MTLHGSASAQEETPHETETIQITISDALRRRAQAVLNDSSIDPQWRSIIRYALGISDPLLPDLVYTPRQGDKAVRSVLSDESKRPMCLNSDNTSWLGSNLNPQKPVSR